ncbi:MAG TPA: O-antigen ligase family protein [Pirellulaceae bacterium]|jgi:tetratricopeptide (TPR) repeat protein/O-antigen ligase|nr:O-antigen ligase family protein [Pirellulaceae bacterium]
MKRRTATFGTSRDAPSGSERESKSRGGRSRGHRSSGRRPGDLAASEGLPLERSIEWALIAACLAVPTLFLGGLHPLGRLIYLGLVATLALYQTLAFPRRDSASTGLGALWLLAVGAVIVQLLPLPPGLLDAVGKGYGELLPTWNGDTEFGRWTTLSLAPQGGKLGLGMLIAHGLFFACIASALRERADLERALVLTACLGLGMATLALAQYSLGNGKYLWLYDYPTRDAQDTAKIPFTNGNHLAHYLALCAGPSIWFLVSAARGAATPTFWRSGRRSRSQFGAAARPDALVFAGAVCLLGVAAALLTFSRGGAVVYLIAASIAVGWYAWRGTIPAKLALGAGAAVAATVVLATLLGGERLARELDADQLSAWERLDPGFLRTRLWLADLEAWERFPLLGAGVGSHREIYAAFYAYWYPKEYRYAESGYIHLLVETGAVGVLLATAAIGLVGWRLLSSRPAAADRSTATASSRRSGSRAREAEGCDLLWGALVASFVVSVVHNVFDFAWFVPGCFALTLLLAATVCRAAVLSQAGAREEERDAADTTRQTHAPTALRPLFVLVGVGALAWIAVTAYLPQVRGARAWDDYMRIAVRFEGRGMFDDSQEAASPEELSQLIQALQARLRATPDDHRASVRLAGLCLRRFEQEQLASDNAFSLADLRETVERSGFDDDAAKRAWIARVVGERQKLLDAAAICARRAVRNSPLDGEAYVYLAAAGPLTATGAPDARTLFDQALASRPYDGTTLLQAAEFAARSGDDATALGRFRTAYRIVPPARPRILNLLGPTLPPELLLDQVGIGETVDGCRQLAERYVSQGRPADASLAAERWSAALIAGSVCESDNPLRSWTALADVYEKLKRPDRAAEALEQAVTLAPEEYVLRRRLAYALLAIGQYDRAETELVRCLQMRPGDQHVQQQRKVCLERRQTAAREAAARAPLGAVR